MSVFFQRFPAHIVRSGARVSGVKTLTPTSHLNISQPGDLTRLARRASSKVPVYFSQENNQQNRGSLPGNLPPTPPVYFSHASQGQGHGASPVQPTKQKRSRWATTIALSSLLASLYISGTFFYLGYCNREEVPFVERVRYNIYSDEAISDELSAKRQLSHFGLPSLEAMATSSLILPHESDNEKANLAYAIFEKLMEANGLTGIRLHVVDDPNQRHAESQMMRDEIFIYTGIFESLDSESAIAAHIAPLLAAEALHHREEKLCYRMAMSNYLMPSVLLLLPVTVVSKFASIITLPLVLAFSVAWYHPKPLDVILDNEAESLTLDFLHNVGVDVIELVIYRAKELDVQLQRMHYIMTSGIQNHTPGDAMRSAEFTETCKRRCEFLINHIDEKYPGAMDRIHRSGLWQEPPFGGNH